ncbi:hypothetical protein [Brevibacillus reuszeri]|uniref:hypothetical protein n=1 Tax=Brevibacillus reuszeri TaxID=54915 RepID=UPI000CCC8FF3|nr:hypothetical protein [Brevibacillus reuszeri]
MIKWLLMTSLAGSISTLLLMFFKARLAAKYGGRLYYGACLSAMLLFILPLQLPVPALYSHSMSFEKNIADDSAKGSVVETSKTIIEQTQPSNPVTTATEENSSLSLSVDQWLLIIWACGFIVTLCRYLLGISCINEKYCVSPSG